MGIYSFTYAVNAVGFFTNKKDSRILKIVVLLLLIFMSGTRYYMGGHDVLVYEGVYNGVPSPWAVIVYFFTGVNNGLNTNYETGFLFLCSIIKFLHFSYFGFTLICAILFYTLMVKGLEDFVQNWSAFFALFMYKMMFYDTFIAIRQGLTIAMFCYMLKYIRDRKWYIYFPLCFLATLEHNGAVILFPMYFVTYMPTSKEFIKNYALILAPTYFISKRIDLSNLILKLGDFFDNSRIEKWADTTEEIKFIHTLECYIIVFLVVFFYEKIVSNKCKKEVKLVLQLFLMAIPIFTLFRSWIVFTREKEYFIMMYGIIFGYILSGKTTTPLEYDDNGYEIYNRLDDRGSKDAIIISFAIIAACFIGMIRYVVVFDDGVLKHFTSFVTEDISLFI